MNFPMTERYDLLIENMRATSIIVSYCFIAAVALIFIRPLIRYILPPDTKLVPVFILNLVYTMADLLIVAPILILFVISN